LIAYLNSKSISNLLMRRKGRYYLGWRIMYSQARPLPRQPQQVEPPARQAEAPYYRPFNERPLPANRERSPLCRHCTTHYSPLGEATLDRGYKGLLTACFALLENVPWEFHSACTICGDEIWKSISLDQENDPYQLAWNLMQPWLVTVRINPQIQPLLYINFQVPEQGMIYLFSRVNL
jgi:hypothetical protein